MKPFQINPKLYCLLFPTSKQEVTKSMSCFDTCHIPLSVLLCRRKERSQEVTWQVYLKQTEAVEQRWLKAEDGPTTKRTRQKGTASHESYAAVTWPWAITLHCDSVWLLCNNCRLWCALSVPVPPNPNNPNILWLFKTNVRERRPQWRPRGKDRSTRVCLQAKIC